MALIDYSWRKIANTKPRMSKHVQVERHFYRQQLWYVIYDKASGRCHRFTAPVYQLLRLMNGERTLQQIWEALQPNDNPPSKEEILHTINQLQVAELLHSDIAPDVLEDRRQKWESSRLKQRYGSPFSIKFPLWDPDEFLQHFVPKTRISIWFFLLWFGIITYGIILAIQHWEVLTHNIADYILAPDNLVIMLLLFPLVKLLHELAHAFTTKYWGGEVHELGILILVFMPLPYVEASSASAFPNKKARIMVDSAGIMVELLIAALAMILWVNIEPGLIRSIAYNTMFICSISTLLFNGNPLLRFDGYYILADAIEIPNLVSRSKHYLGYLFQRYLVNVKSVISPAESWNEASWLVFYGIAAFCYRIFISAVIIFFVANEFFIIGILVAIWAVYLFLVAPIFKNIHYLLTNPTMRTRKLRLFLIFSLIIGGLTYGLFWLPVPLWSNVDGVVWPPEQSHVRVEASGFCKEILVQPGEKVIAGQPLMVLEDIELESKYLVLQHQLAELEARYTALWKNNYPEALVLQEKIESFAADLAKHKKQLERLVVLSPQNGLIYIPRHERLLKHFLRQGELIAYVVEPPVNIVMAVVQQKDIALVRRGVEYVEIRLADRLEHVYLANIESSVPKASDYLPSKILATSGGGSIPTDPTDSNADSLKTYEPVFQYEVKLPYELFITKIGGRVYLRFYHGTEPLAWQWYRLIRQLFLRSFEM